MGIIDRLSTLIRSNINDLISRAENPQKVLEQLIIDMRNQLAKAKQQVAAAIADEKRLSAQAEQEKKLSEDWEKRAVLAVQEGRDDLAKQALLRYNEHVQGAVQLQETWIKHREETEKLKASLRQLNDKIEEAKRKKNILIARQKRAEAHKRIQETLGSISDKSAFETFERMAEQIEHEERKLIAAAEVNEDLSGDSLVKQFQGIEVKANADEQLLALKRKMGLLPGGTQEQARALGKGAKDAELLEDDDAEQKSWTVRRLLLPIGCRAPRLWRSLLRPSSSCSFSRSSMSCCCYFWPSSSRSTSRRSRTGWSAGFECAAGWALRSPYSAPWQGWWA